MARVDKALPGTAGRRSTAADSRLVKPPDDSNEDYRIAWPLKGHSLRWFGCINDITVTDLGNLAKQVLLQFCATALARMVCAPRGNGGFTAFMVTKLPQKARGVVSYKGGLLLGQALHHAAPCDKCACVGAWVGGWVAPWRSCVMSHVPRGLGPAIPCKGPFDQPPPQRCSGLRCRAALDRLWSSVPSTQRRSPSCRAQRGALATLTAKAKSPSQ